MVGIIGVNSIKFKTIHKISLSIVRIYVSKYKKVVTIIGNEYLYKILAVERIIQKEPYGITAKEIIDKLDNLYGIKTERKSVYSNIAVLTRFMPIEVFKANGKNVYCLTKKEGLK